MTDFIRGLDLGRVVVFTVLAIMWAGVLVLLAVGWWRRWRLRIFTRRRDDR